MMTFEASGAQGGAACAKAGNVHNERMAAATRRAAAGMRTMSM
jgi:hypothetical protein